MGLAALGLLPPEARIQSGQINWRGENLITDNKRAFARLRGREIGMIFQDARASLNPVYKIGTQMRWILKDNLDISSKEALRMTLDLLEQVQMPSPELSVKRYPHQLSGGMCQRVMIAMSIALQPSLLIADEPTNGLDVTIQAGILNLLRNLAKNKEMAILFISHDLAVTSQLCDQIAVMRGGRILEKTPTREFFRQPKSEYAKSLLDAMPCIISH